MSDHLDLAMLHQITLGDTALERELLEMFLDTAIESLDGMKANMQKGGEQLWHRQAHILKGSSLNLGAVSLGQLCRTAIDHDYAEVAAKKEVLTSILVEFEHVKGLIDTRLSAIA